MNRKTNFILLFFFLGFYFFSSAQPVIIKGHVSVKKRDTITIRSVNGVVDLVDYDAKKERVASVFPDKNGNFRVICPSSSDGRYYTLVKGEDHIFFGVYLYPGDSIFVEITDTSNHYSGNGESAAIYSDSCLRKGYIPIASVMKLSTDSFLRNIDSCITDQLNFIDRFARLENWNAQRKQHAIWDAKYSWQNEKLQYITFHPFITHQSNVVKVEPSYFSMITSSDLHNESALNTNGYISLLRNLADAMLTEKWEHLPAETKKALVPTKLEWDRKETMKLIDSLYSGKIKEVVMGLYTENMFMSLQYDKEGKKAERLKLIDSLLGILGRDTATYHTGIYSRLAEKRRKVFDRNNTLATTFTLPDTSGKKLSLNDFRGKVVLIDFWEVGCVPCMEAIPHSNKLQEDLAGKDFVVLSICCHSPDKYWKLFIDKFKWKGVHLASHDKMEDGYGVQGYPDYVLIDKKGIIRHDNAILNDDLKAEITALLGEK